MLILAVVHQLKLRNLIVPTSASTSVAASVTPESNGEVESADKKLTMQAIKELDPAVKHVYLSKYLLINLCTFALEERSS